MENNSEEIYQKFIEDNQFVEWVKSDNQLHKDYWDEWKKTHPEAGEDFKKAIQSIKLLNFKGVQVDPSLVSQRWDEVKSQLNRKPHSNNIKRILSRIQYAAAVLFLPIILFSAYLIYQNSQLKQEKQFIVDAQTEVVHTVEALSGSKVIVDLPDSSKVWLNSGSVLKYPARFASNKREVEIQGEGYFEVSKSQTPFMVKNSGPTIKVYGTEFNLDAYDGRNITLALVEGNVSVLHKNKEFFVKPGELVEFNNQTNKLNIEKTELEEYTSWIEGYYIFRGRNLESILKKLQYRYNCEFIFEDQELTTLKYNAMIKDLGLDQLLHYLSLTGPIDYSIEKVKSTRGIDGVKVRIKKKS